jgi:hypothetical protein
LHLTSGGVTSGLGRCSVSASFGAPRYSGREYRQAGLSFPVSAFSFGDENFGFGSDSRRWFVRDRLPQWVEAVRKLTEFCKRPRRARYFVIFPLLKGLRARKSEQNRPV